MLSPPEAPCTQRMHLDIRHDYLKAFREDDLLFWNTFNELRERDTDRWIFE